MEDCGRPYLKQIFFLIVFVLFCRGRFFIFILPHCKRYLNNSFSSLWVKVSLCNLPTITLTSDQAFSCPIDEVCDRLQSRLHHKCSPLTSIASTHPCSLHTHSFNTQCIPDTINPTNPRSFPSCSTTYTCFLHSLCQ